jgi:carboxyl-terminal processing protease
MTSMLRLLRVTAVAWLTIAGAAFAATPAPALTDEVLAPLTSAYVRAVKPGQQAEFHRDLFPTVLARVQARHAQEVDMPALIAAAQKTVESLEPGSGEPADVFVKAINAGLGTLDPHSRYLDARALNRHRNSVTGTFVGLGIQIEMVDTLVRILAPIPNTPAARAGLQKGDVIVRLDDQPVDGMTLADAVARMRGEPGTPIELTIRRSGQEDPISVSLVREAIRSEPVRWRMEGSVLVIRLLAFTSSMFAEMEKAIVEATAERNPRAVVLDLRGNGGGLLRQALLTADAFLSAGDIVSLQSRTANRRVWKADASERLAGVPMVILIDGRTASASELVAAALQENGRAIVMGQRSFGKGSVQALMSLGEEKGALRLTTALYHGPSGRTVQRTGVGPDIELLPTPTPAAANRRREADRAAALPGADEPPPPKARVEEARCMRRKTADAAIACALMFFDAGGIDSFVTATAGARASLPAQP